MGQRTVSAGEIRQVLAEMTVVQAAGYAAAALAALLLALVARVVAPLVGAVIGYVSGGAVVALLGLLVGAAGEDSAPARVGRALLETAAARVAAHMTGGAR